MDNMQEYVNQPIDDASDKQSIINTTYNQLSYVIKSAYDSCSRVVSITSTNKNKVWYTNDL